MDDEKVAIIFIHPDWMRELKNFLQFLGLEIFFELICKPLWKDFKKREEGRVFEELDVIIKIRFIYFKIKKP